MLASAARAGFEHVPRLAEPIHPLLQLLSEASANVRAHRLKHELPHLVAARGRTAEALDLMVETMNLTASIVPEYDWLHGNLDFEPVRQDPRFATVLQASKARFERMLAVLEAARARGEVPAYLETGLANLLSRLGMEE